MNLALAENYLLAECKEDFVGLWGLVKDIREAEDVEPSAVRETTLGLLCRLLSQDKIVAGEFDEVKPNEYVFRRWEMTPNEIVIRIGNEWSKLGRDPGLGEIVWFTAR